MGWPCKSVSPSLKRFNAMSGLNYFSQRQMEKIQPSGYAEYMSEYGEHFSKKMCEWAVSRMRDGSGSKIEPLTKEQVDTMLKDFGVELNNNKGYDSVYVANMCKADFLGDSVPDNQRMVRYVKNLLDDPDGYEGLVFNRFVMDCAGMGVPIIWEDML